MADFFPHHTIEWKLQQPGAIRRIALSLPAMAILTGIVVHLYRWLILSSYGTMSLWSVVASIGGGLVLLLGLATAHLGNHTVRQWLWRAPLFALVEAATEAVLGALLIALGVERIGTAVAHWSDWPTLVLAALRWRSTPILAFALLLAAVVQSIRFALLKYEHRSSTAVLIHERHSEDKP
ncbi:MAG TPA: hypothetical protein VF041_16185 [Gemmatimonadaceae bacterium]